MRRFFPLLCLLIAALCVFAAFPLLVDIHSMVRAVLPMVTSYEGFASLVASMYMLLIVTMLFFAGVFVTMAFTVRLENKKTDG